MSYPQPITVEGFKELHGRLLALDPKYVKPALRTSLRAGAYVLLAEAKTRSPVAGKLSTYMVAKGYALGDLRKSHRVRVTPGRKRGEVSYSVITGASGFFAGKQFYGGMVHYGTDYQKANPWIKDAFVAQTNAMIAMIKSKLTSVLEALGV